MPRLPKIALLIAASAVLALAGPSAASAATCTGSTGSPYSNGITATRGVVSYWRVGESSGTAACDSWGANGGTYQGGYSLGGVGRLGGDSNTAVGLDGSTGQVRVPHSTSLDVGDTFTVEAWVKRARFGAQAYEAVASQEANSWLLAFDQSNRLVLRQAKVGDLVYSTKSVSDTNWHHVAVTKSGASVHLYLDGTDVTGTVTNRTMLNNTLPLSIGQSSSSAYFSGTIDEVALYRSALAASQVKSHYSAGAVTPSPTPSPTPSIDPVIGAAGDIACDPSDPGYNAGNGVAGRCQQKATSNLVVGTGLSGVITLGDEQYDDATLAKFQSVYAGTWGRANPLNHPGIGNHEYLTSGAAGYFDYFNGVGSQTGPAGDRSKGYYSFNLGTWHIVALNSNCSAVSCAYGSAQETWLPSVLARQPPKLTVAVCHL